ncbi:3',5'-cyclic-nucleotide phosphodiesterase [Serinicoccus chungangensis]|uniref:3',5'-cyclic-nucleotide phosphodiesterase n=1 Tax=Serinicoccus chungangensis TaxID=767452 RepID=A0A0W8I0L2_9MICO|nr:metallophosphoesterase [Serinicoccus chungangensis]KUG51159.1 3',5'-cyclic-nucleotide phosphodiesterase [Serinicoccus chungangensis]
MSTPQFGQHPAPLRTIAHVSDTHLLADGARQFGAIDTTAHAREALERLTRLDPAPDAIVVTGDLADRGEPAAYRELRAMVEPLATDLGAQVVWVMGNHDERPAYAAELFDREAGVEEAQDAVYDVGGLRVVSLDTTVPGYHHGDLREEQLAWLTEVLATPAEHGTVLALHHPPIPVPMVPAAAIIELLDQDRLAAVLEGTDVVSILGGHFHFSSHSTFAGIPVSVAAATCYLEDPAPLGRFTSALDAHQSVNVVHVYADRVVHTVVPVAAAPEVAGHPAEVVEQLAALTPEQRREMISRKGARGAQE